MSFADEHRRRRQLKNERDLRDLLGTLEPPQESISDLELSVEAAALLIDAAVRLSERLPEIGLEEALKIHIDQPHRGDALDLIARYEAIASELSAFATLLEAQLRQRG